MDKKTHVEDFDNMQDQVRDLFKESVSKKAYGIWEDSFDVEKTGKKNFTIYYHGIPPIKTFKKECTDVLKDCIASLEGGKVKIKIVKSEAPKVTNPRLKKNIRAFKFLFFGMIFACISVFFITILCNYINNRDFRETFYNVSSLKVNERIRVVQVSDLHSCVYGNGNSDLAERIERLEPDIIICTGDIIDKAKPEAVFAMNLCSKLVKIAPTYYIYGNNEVEKIYGFALNEKEIDEKLGFDKTNRDETKLLELKDTYEQSLEATGVKVLKNEKDTITLGTTNVDIYGVLTSNPSSFWSYTEKSFADYINENPDNLKITAIHEPFIFQEFDPEFWGDLMVCGHTHGGIVRVPVLGPLYTNEGGIFPERKGDYVYGRYDVAGRPLIVSSGLENKGIFRINNQPELVIVDINKF